MIESDEVEAAEGRVVGVGVGQVLFDVGGEGNEVGGSDVPVRPGSTGSGGGGSNSGGGGGSSVIVAIIVTIFATASVSVGVSCCRSRYCRDGRDGDGRRTSAPLFLTLFDISIALRIAWRRGRGADVRPDAAIEEVAQILRRGMGVVIRILHGVRKWNSAHNGRMGRSE